MARNRSRSFTRRTPANKSWAGHVSTGTTTVAAATKVLVTTFTLSNQGIDETILRTVGQLGVASDQQAQNEQQQGAMGLCVVTDAAAAVGITAIPGPVTDMSDDVWLLHVPFVNRFLFGSGVGIHANGMNSVDFDSKAKRVVHSGTQLALVIENAHAGNAFIIAVSIRLLSMVRGT